MPHSGGRNSPRTIPPLACNACDRPRSRPAPQRGTHHERTSRPLRQCPRAKVLRHINSADEVIADSALPHTTQELVRIRASQINDCSFPTDTHTKNETHAGKSRQRLDPAARREATVLTRAERTALELAEQGTRTADAVGDVTDEVWAEASRYYDEDRLAALVSLLGVINAYNRIDVAGRMAATGPVSSADSAPPRQPRTGNKLSHRQDALCPTGRAPDTATRAAPVGPGRRRPVRGSRRGARPADAAPRDIHSRHPRPTRH